MTLEVTDAFDITHRGIIVFFKQVENGLPADTVLVSASRDLKWCVKNRLLWVHSARDSKRFSNEKELLGRASFGHDDGWEERYSASIEAAPNTFVYQLEPINHNNKPLKGEILEIAT